MVDGDPATRSNLPDAGLDVVAPSRWHAALRLRYERSGARTVLATRSHTGPLVVQRSLYPEGDAVCQNIIVHPPAGMVGGDSLSIDVDAAPGVHAQLTTPGAAKWYRSSGLAARQDVTLRVRAGATLEWLPQESIVFDGAISELDTRVELDGDAAFIGWDVVCLGRSAAGERFSQGHLRQRIALTRDRNALFIERAGLEGGDPLLASPVGLNGAVVFGTFIAALSAVPDAMLAACRDIAASENADDTTAETAVTRMRGCLVGRYRGASAQGARAYFARLWCAVRPLAFGLAAVAPRIWNT